MDCISSLPDNKIKMHSDSLFLDQVAFTANKLSEVKSTNFDLDVRIASIYGRTALILGDHKASKIGNTKFPIEGELINSDLVYANTNKERSSQLAEPLASHLCRVAAKTNKALNSLIIEPDQMPSLSLEETPRTIRYPDPGKGTPFEWQYQSSKATKKALSTIYDDSDVGFFGVLMAGTGSGKTRMAPIIMSALSDNKLRMNVCTGMRTLTLQGGLEYQRDMGFKSEDVSVVIGDELTSELFNLDHTSVGTEAESLDGMIVAQLSEEKNGYPVALPDNIKKVMTSDKNEDSDNIFMATPILVSTIDTLMAAADATRGGHVIKSLRVATADLVIDEIDDYANEDLVAIARLVYLSAVFGRKVLLSSATISPEIALSMYNAYQAGRNVYDHLKQKNSPTIIGWYSDVSEPKIEVVNSKDFHFADHHKDFICNIVKVLEFKNARRKLEIFETNNDGQSKFFGSIIDGMLRLHHDNHVVDETTGKRVSLGVIRWTNVLPSFLCSQELLNTVDRKADILVVPYNGAMLPVMRYHTERMLNSMLKRKHSETDTDPVLRNKAIREALETRTTKKDVIIVTVTTSIEEVGRDHDFDWAIVEPCSVRSLVQMAGRVKRHRPHITASKPNMLLLQKCFKEVLALFSGKSYHSDNYYLPHIVLRNRNYLNSVKEKFSLDTHDSDIIYDICKLSNKIDASECISEIDQINSKLQTNERLLTKAYLLDDLNEEEYLSVNHYSNDYMSILTNFHQRHRKFRRSDRFDVPYSYVEGSEGNFNFYVYDKEINQTYNLSINNLIDILEINIDRLLLRHKNIKSLTDELANRLWSGDDESFGQKKNSLTTIIRPLHSADQRLGRKGVKYTDHKMLFEQNLGMVEKPKWYQTI
jgi:CRISPR-associated endonuclease/helicase Cas3